MKCPKCNTEIPDTQVQAEANRLRGQKGWTPERRKAQSERMKKVRKK